MVGNAGTIEAEVVPSPRRARTTTCAGSISTSASSAVSPRRWTESIRYQIRNAARRGDVAPCVLAGPTLLCDSADVMYEKQLTPLPDKLEIGDKVLSRARALHRDLFVGRLQRFSAAEDVSHLTGSDGG